MIWRGRKIMLDTLLLAGLFGLGVCIVAFALVKPAAPITAKDAKMIWMIHTNTSELRKPQVAAVWNAVMKRFVGFQCDCGYRYTQRKPLVCVSPGTSWERVTNILLPFLFCWLGFLFPNSQSFIPHHSRCQNDYDQRKVLYESMCLNWTT